MSGRFRAMCAATAGMAWAAAGGMAGPCDPGDLFAAPDVYSVGTAPRGLAVADLNGNGHLDIVTANTNSDDVSILLNNGDGSYADQMAYAAGDGPRRVVLGDLNGSGLSDIVVVNGNSNDASVLINNGDGTFATQITYGVGSEPWGVALGDLDGDGHLDMVVANRASNDLSVLLGRGDGSFGRETRIAVVNGPRGVALGDLDGDGFLDIVVSVVIQGSTNGGVSVLLNGGEGTFSQAGFYELGLLSQTPVLGDLDGDGDLDLVVPNLGVGSTISVLINDGDGRFADEVRYNAGTSPFDLALGDLDRDGDLDIIVANNSPTTDLVSVLPNNGDGTFAARTTYTVANSPRGVAVGDVNGDGALDLIVACDNVSNAVAVLLGLCVPQPPRIVEQPEGVVAGPGSQQVIFSLVVDSALPESYQWLRNGSTLVDNARISGSQTPTLTIFADATDVAAYRCVVTNADGQAVSMPAILGFLPNPCVADLTADGILNFTDVLAFLSSFNAGCP